MSDRLFTGHVWYYDTDGHDGEGTDALVTVWADGTTTIALRPGRDQTNWTWGPPATLTEQPPT